LRFFGFNLLYGLIFWAVLGVVGLMLWLMFRSSSMHASGAVALVVAVVVIFAVLFVAVIAAVGYIFIKDFTIPMLAIENASMSSALSRLWRMIRAHPGAYAGYWGMKILLALAAAVLL